jgi:hypothetical protein
LTPVRRVRAQVWRSAVGGDSAGRVDEGGARARRAGRNRRRRRAVRRRSRPGGGPAREPRHLGRGHRLGARIVGHTAQHAQSGTGAVGVLTAATPTAPVSTSVTWRNRCRRSRRRPCCCPSSLTSHRPWSVLYRELRTLASSRCGATCSPERRHVSGPIGRPARAVRVPRRVLRPGRPPLR